MSKSNKSSIHRRGNDHAENNNPTIHAVDDECYQPKIADSGTTRHRTAPVLPLRMVELVAREIARGFAGDVKVGSATHRRLTQALRPHEIALTQSLCSETQIFADGKIRLTVPRNFTFSDVHLETDKSTISVDYDPKTGRWFSEISSGWPGFDRLCAHVWRIRGRADGMAARKLLAHIGAAYLVYLSQNGPGLE